MNATLQEKISQARDRLARLLDAGNLAPGTTAVAWTGGKDSTLALYLWREFLAEHFPGETPRALNLDTGHEFPEIIEFRDRIAREWGIDLQVVRPSLSPEQEQAAVPANKAECCGLRKIAPLKQGIADNAIATLITGVRRDEHPSRLDRPWIEPMLEPPHSRVHLILELTETDVWAVTAERGIPYCPLYDLGYRSLGCGPCTRNPMDAGQGDERAGRDPDKESILAQLHGLGYF
ncbi:MAG: phosphoadenosine phosphosulfate reductase family protein [Desulfovibrio sp.]|nr:MAG: phosphoadenosine phosphosulfate reductase family protein [Desulfovibrio sp.]